MKRTTSILALAGALAGFGTMAAAQSGGDVVCRDFLLMDEQQQGNVVLELVQTEDGIATTSDIEGDYAIGQVDGLITACEMNPEKTTAELAAEAFGEEDGAGEEMQTGAAVADEQTAEDMETDVETGEMSGTSAETEADADAEMGTEDGMAAETGADTSAEATTDGVSDAMADGTAEDAGSAGGDTADAEDAGSADTDSGSEDGSDSEED